MPGGDGTGPGGMGPMTGRAAGYCAGYTMPGFMNPISGRGFWGGGGRGFGRGRGWGRGFGMGLPASGMAPYAGTPYGSYNAPYGATSVAPYGAAWAGQMTPQQELDGLKGQAEYFEDALDGIQKRIGELEAEAKKK